MTNHKEVLSSAVNTLRDRVGQYGNEDQLFDRASRIASAMMARPVTPYELAMMQVAIKLARMTSNPRKLDNYVDSINYMAFAAQFGEVELGTVEQEQIANIARRYSPDREEGQSDQ